MCMLEFDYMAECLDFGSFADGYFFLLRVTDRNSAYGDSFCCWISYFTSRIGPFEKNAAR